MSSNVVLDECVICKKCILNKKEASELHDKGCKSINRISVLRDDDIFTTAGQYVHRQCRMEYCNIHVLNRDLKKQPTESTPTRSTRSEEPGFDFSKNCLFCGQYAKLSGRKRGYDVFPVRTSDFQNTIMETCKSRKDDWAEKVFCRVEFAQDLHARDAIYHQVCSSNFRTGKQVPLGFQSAAKQLRIGRPKNEINEEAFTKVIEFLKQHPNEQIIIGDLVAKMEQYGCFEVFSHKYMKQRIIEHFGDNVIISNLPGKPNVVTFRQTVAELMEDYYRTPKEEDIEAEKIRVITMAASLVKNDILSINLPKDTYPTATNVSSTEDNNSFVPKSLHQLLKTIFAKCDSDIRIAAIGQAIVQAARPRLLLAPLQIGLAIQMHHQFASKFLIDTLYRMGFCSSYSEVQRFEVSAAKAQGTDLPNVGPNHCVQFIADNADHNANTLDGHNTFHGMGIIAAVTPSVPFQKAIPRLDINTETLKEVGKIKIHFFKSCDVGSLPLKYSELNENNYEDPTSHLDVLWKVSWPLRSPRPGWSGFMQTVSTGSHDGSASIVFLPMIDMSASDMTCIYSTLQFVHNEAMRHDVHPILTFDQPLWWKAQLILASEPVDSKLHSIVLRLGGFHTEMSFLGCIGHIMRGTGLQEVLEIAYAPNTVIHMLSGKAVARAVRGHFLIDGVLNSILVAKVFSLQLPVTHAENAVNGEDAPSMQVDSDETSDLVEEQTDTSLTGSQRCTEEDNPIGADLAKALDLFDRLIDGDMTADMISTSDAQCLKKISQTLTEEKNTMTGRTALLWLQYMDMIDLLRQFIKAERTGDWFLHLKSLKEMLPYFAAAGHNLYAKSVHIYLQQMTKLAAVHPEVYAQFCAGKHVVRRSDRFWAGLSSDLIIEQTLMRNMKTTGGLTRGKSITEAQRTQWLLSMPACSDINAGMQQYTEADHDTSDKHKDMTKSRQERDEKDTLKILGFLQDRNPFTEDQALRNIHSGVTADASVNCDKAKEIGNNIIKSLPGQKVSDHTFKRKDQIVTLSHKTLVKVDGESISVDPQLLFQRLVTAAGGVTDSIHDIFQYELSRFPSSLFEPSGLLRKSNKPVLAEAIWTIAKRSNLPIETPIKSQDVTYVLDGGALLQRLPWTRDSTFLDVCKTYVNYVTSKYTSPTIVFDGYNTGPSTKDVTHLRRTGGVAGVQVNFSETMPVKSKKEDFLSNSTNKQRFIDMLSGKLNENGCHTRHAENDADLLIVQTAVEMAETRTTVVVGDDTDLLVLLCYHAKSDAFPIFFKSEGKRSGKVPGLWNIRDIQGVLGSDICSCLPVIHAISGCDTTSRLFGVGKGVAMKKLKDDMHIKSQCQVFCRDDATTDEIQSAGESIVSSLYSGCHGEGLDKLRHRRFLEKVTTSTTFVQVQTLPPTSAAARYHSERVYLQVQDWICPGNKLRAESWGWKNCEGKFQPKTTDLAPAPDSLLRIIRCSCKTECDTRRCTCRKHGLQCSFACGDCKGLSCLNSSVVPNTDDCGDGDDAGDDDSDRV